jgi:hypothetical protein
MILPRHLLLGLGCLLLACAGPEGGADGGPGADLARPDQLPQDSLPEVEELVLDLAQEDLPDLTLLEDLERVWFIPGGLEEATLRALGHSGDLTLAAGDGGLLLRRVGDGSFGPLLPPDQRDLKGIWMRSDGAALICGDQGLLLELDASGLHPFSPQPPTTVDLLAIAGTGQRFFVAGAEGLLLFFDGQTFHHQESFLAASLPSLTLRSLVEVYAGSAQGSVLSRLGETWINNQIFGNNSAVTALGLAADGTLFAGGSGGEISLLRDSQWTAAASNDPLGRAIRAVAPDLPLFLGDRGLVLRPTGKNWVVDGSALPPGFNQDLLALVALDDAGGLLAAGAGGTLLARQGAGLWVSQPLVPQAEISSLVPEALGGLWLAGRDFLYHSPEGLSWEAAPLDRPIQLRALSPLSEGGVLAVGTGAVLLEVPNPGGPLLVHPLEGAPEILSLCRLGPQTLVLGGAFGYLALVEGPQFTLQRLESGQDQDLGTCLALEGEAGVLLPGPPGLVLRLGAEGDLEEESLPLPSQVVLLLAGPQGRPLALLEDGKLLARQAPGEWSVLFQVPATTLSLLWLEEGFLLGGGRQGQLWAWAEDGTRLEVGQLAEPSPLSLLGTWDQKVFVGGSGGRLFVAPVPAPGRASRVN